MQVAKWGNSLGVRLPVALVRQLGLSEGDDVQLVPLAGRDATAVAALSISRTPGKRERLAALRRFRSPMPRGYRFAREEANARR